MLRPGRGAVRRYGLGVLVIAATMAYSGVLGALLTFASQPLYPIYRGSPAVGLTALEDQQLARLIMWVPGGALYAIAGVVLLLRWLTALEELARSHHARATDGSQHLDRHV